MAETETQESSYSTIHKQALQTITFYGRWPKVKCRGCGRLYLIEPTEGMGLCYRHPDVKKCPDSGLVMKMGLHPMALEV